MSGANSKQAEKDYLRRSGSLEWERVKPFAPPATDTLQESLRLMHDFAVAVNALDASAGHRILDLGAGSCWTSEWLARLNLSVVSVDIAHDMLMVGQARLASLAHARNGADLVNADLESLPFPSESFDRALCLNALHHVPDVGAALREVARVLGPQGRLVLVEPGRGHAQRETSKTAVSEFGVLEQDLEASDLMRLCTEAGFARVTVWPLSYMAGEIELAQDDLARWRKWARTARPLRAVGKLWRALLEVPGVGKAGPLFEDSLSMWVSRVLLRHVGEQSVVVATKSGYVGDRPKYRAAIAVDSSAADASDRFRYKLRLRNAGSVTWRARSRSGRVQVGVQLLDGARTVLNRDYSRVSLPHDVAPGAECLVDIDPPLPQSAGPHYFRFDLVAEGIAWFDANEPAPVIVPASVSRRDRG
jgi:SAM-dependent methyltransferase